MGSLVAFPRVFNDALEKVYKMKHGATEGQCKASMHAGMTRTATKFPDEKHTRRLPSTRSAVADLCSSCRY